MVLLEFTPTKKEVCYPISLKKENKILLDDLTITGNHIWFGIDLSIFSVKVKQLSSVNHTNIYEALHVLKNENFSQTEFFFFFRKINSLSSLAKPLISRNISQIVWQHTVLKIEIFGNSLSPKKYFVKSIL